MFLRLPRLPSSPTPQAACTRLPSGLRLKAAQAPRRALLSLVAGLCGCAGAAELPLGQLELQLSSGGADSYYRLSDASFEIHGNRSISVSSEHAAASSQLSLSLPVGSYEVELLEGWRLLHVTPEGEQVTAARLLSEARLAFNIQQAERTKVFFEFETNDSEAGETAEGHLSVGIRVNGHEGASIAITEIMRNPATLRDSTGEWIELYNASSAPFDLAGCTLVRASQRFDFPDATFVNAGSFLTLANSADPGFEPDVVYRGLTLPNSGGIDLELLCGDQQLDAVRLSGAAVSNRAGVSLSLSSDKMDASSNDRTESWCAAGASFNGDLGTPGGPNPECPPGQ